MYIIKYSVRFWLSILCNRVKIVRHIYNNTYICALYTHFTMQPCLHSKRRSRYECLFQKCIASINITNYVNFEKLCSFIFSQQMRIIEYLKVPLQRMSTFAQEYWHLFTSCMRDVNRNEAAQLQKWKILLDMLQKRFFFFIIRHLSKCIEIKMKGVFIQNRNIVRQIYKVFKKKKF